MGKEDDDEDMEGLSNELKSVAPHAHVFGNRHISRVNDEGIDPETAHSEMNDSREGDLENGIVKTVSLDVRY